VLDEGEGETVDDGDAGVKVDVVGTVEAPTEAGFEHPVSTSISPTPMPLTRTRAIRTRFM
jgi:hypothetical protein